MTLNSWLQPLLLLFTLFILAKPLGRYIANIFQEKPALLNQIGYQLEQKIYSICRINPHKEMNWKQFAIAILLFNTLGVIATYVIQRFQTWLPLNPQHFSNIKSDLAFNVSISFATATDWQSYAGESSMSYLTQMLVLGVQNFFSGGTTIVVLMALIRGFTRNTTELIGNFWVDITRTILYILLPLSIIFAIFFMHQGVIQNFDNYKKVSLLQPQIYPSDDINSSVTVQNLPMGPVASQEAIKLLGSNGGGSFNADSSHPFENPSPLSNFLQMIAIFLIPVALCHTFGILIGDIRQGWSILVTMTLIFLVTSYLLIYAEHQGNPLLKHIEANHAIPLIQNNGNMEGKETRFGITTSALYSAVATASSCGATNTSLDSLTPLGGLIALWLIQSQEIIFGGSGSGLYSMIIFIILTTFIAGLMIGHTPVYLGKKIEAFEMKMVSFIILIIPLLILGGTAISVITNLGKSGILNPGPHGFTEILYAFSSTTNNNGSPFAGLSSNTLYYNIILSISIWFGRFGVIISILAIAGSLARKKRLAVTNGSLPTHGMLFISLLIGVIVLIGALTYIPALAFGPIVESIMLFKL